MKLYVVPTPIGNLKDITLRAIEVLSRVECIICEDTRKTNILLSHYNIKGKKLIPYFAPKEEKKLPYILNLLKKHDCALVSDSGMPAILDPGYKLIKKAIEKKIPVEVLPGPSAFLTSIVGSGLPCFRFLFLGFLPKKGLENFLKKYKDFDFTIVFYESPKRISKVLNLIDEIFGNVYFVIAREISKIHEEYLRGNVKDLLKMLKEKKIKGELTCVFNPKFYSLNSDNLCM